MLRSLLLLGCLLGTTTTLAGNPPPQPMLRGLQHPTSVTVSPEGRVYVSESGAFHQNGDGRILVIDAAGKAVPFATGLDDPQSMAYAQKTLFVTDQQRVWRIDAQGNAQIYAAKEAFPTEPTALKDIVIDERGLLYVTDAGDGKDQSGAIFRIDQKGRVRVIADRKTIAGLKRPSGLVMDGRSFLLLLDAATGKLMRVRIADGTASTIADGLAGADGLVWDYFGQLFITSSKTGNVWGIARPGEKPVRLASDLVSAGHAGLAPDGQTILIPKVNAGNIIALSTTIPGWEVDQTPLAYKGVPAFANLEWTGWQAETEAGLVKPLRPLLLTHAGDGSNRIFVVIQHGTIHVFPNNPKVTRTKVFLDIEDQVFYSDKENEQGLLGLAFHPRYQSNGEFFVFYTLKEDKTVNVLSRFRVSKDDPNQADPTSEEVLFSIKRPFWNHDGGTICFGPDGFLYIVLGDGGSANDPFKNGQNLNTLLGKILRIDVDRREDAKKYAIPKDNPFVGKKGVAPEIWAYGLRNPWRIAFDHKTGMLWAGEVGQNLYEEINLITRGGNYGWNKREAFHPFGSNGVDVNDAMIDPIWEYHHDIGKSITGGLVYRGPRLPELQGHYLYADYVSGRVWALKYDPAQKRVVANRPLPNMGGSLVSFGEDEQGEVYYMTPTLSGQGIFRFEAANGQE